MKALERRIDCVIRPVAETEPLCVAEFQMHRDNKIYTRIVVESALLQEASKMRPVRPLIIFADKRLDPKTQPWAAAVQVLYLDAALAALAQREPQHPLIAVFSPIMVKSVVQLEKQARSDYDHIRNAPLDEEQREQLLMIFENLLFKRLPHKTKQEIAMMLKFIDVSKTRFGRDMIEQGREEGMLGMLCRMARRRFPGLPKSVEAKISGLTYQQGEALGDDLLDMESLAALKAWLKAQAPQR